MKKLVKSLSTGTVLALVLAWCIHATSSPSGEINVSPVLPLDIPGGAPNATLEQAAAFAWNELIALTWPASAGTRDVPDTSQRYGSGAASPDGPPLVWETFRAKVEIYPGTTAPVALDADFVKDQNPPHGALQGPPDFGYEEPPQYHYATRPVDPSTPLVTGPCDSAQAAEPTAWINLDEQTQIGLNQMYAGAVPEAGDVPDPSQRILFLAKANKTAYTYVVDPANFKGATKLHQAVWNQAYRPPKERAKERATGHPSRTPTDNTLYNTALANFQTYRTQVLQGKPATLTEPYVSFPPGTVEVKSAWRPLTDDERKSGRFHVARVRYYKKRWNEDAKKVEICWRQANWGMLSLHVIQKTPTAPYFIYATFSQADNILTEHGARVEDENGVQKNRPCFDNGLDTGLGTPPRVQAYLATPNGKETYNVASSGCKTPWSRLYYVNTALTDPTTGKALPLSEQVTPQGPVCIDQRAHPIPAEIVAANGQAHAAMKAYNGNREMVWSYYKLINVQHKPIDKPPGVFFGDDDGCETDDLHSGSLASTYYLANEVVETNFNLQFFSGILTKQYGGLLMSDYFGPNSAPDGIPAGQPAKNTFFIHDRKPSQVTTYNMGGCMGCHGNAQQSGDDFSFILNGGRNDAPDAFDLPGRPPAQPGFRYRLP